MALYEPLDKELRGILENLAEGLFPLDVWIRGTPSIKPKKYIPPQIDTPWRAAGKSLSPANIGVMQFFEGLLRETSGDVALLMRWDEIRSDPLKFSHLPNPQVWRAQRSLDPDPKFGITESKNTLTDTEGKQLPRTSFYASYSPLLKTAVKARQPQGPDAWQAFASELFRDQCPQWPTDPPLRSSRFITQLASDLLYAMLGMRNAAPPGQPEVFEYALLIELGEKRRVGNRCTSEDVKAAVAAFEEKIQEYAKKK
jgi:hypothetical protein